jgi:peptide subunit release factor 1 (eRF1)
MIEDKGLSDLVAYSGKGQVLSLYLDTDLAHRSKEAIKLSFRERSKGLDKLAAADILAVEKYLDYEYDWQSRGLAIFAAGEELWRIVPLPIAVTTQAVWADKPYVRVLSDVLDRFGSYVVALLDRESLRLLSISWAQVQAEASAVGDELKHHKQGGRSAARFQRHENNLALHNLKQAVELTQSFLQEAGSKRLMLAGSSAVIAEFRELLPKALRAQVIAEFAADREASDNELLVRSLDIAAQVDQQREAQLVADTITAAAKGGAGVIGMDDTLAALHQGRVHQLLVQEDFHAGGYVCRRCGYIGAAKSVTCPFCGYDAMDEVPDAINRAIQKAVQTGAAVIVVRQNEALTKAGGIAAALRY